MKEEKMATLRVDIQPEALKRVVKEGRLSEFVNTFPGLVAGHIKGQIVEQLAKGEGVSMVVEYDEEFGTGPKPWPFIDTVPLPESRLRYILREELKGIRKP